jgi:hypothetical protein
MKKLTCLIFHLIPNLLNFATEPEPARAIQITGPFDIFDEQPRTHGITIGKYYRFTDQWPSPATMKAWDCRHGSVPFTSCDDVAFVWSLLTEFIVPVLKNLLVLLLCLLCQG